VGEKTQVVMWVDAEQLTAEKLGQVEKSVLAMTPEGQQKETRRGFAMAQKVVAGFVAAGGTVLVSGTSELPVQPGDETARVKAKSTVMIKLKAGATAEGFERDIKALMDAVEKEFPEQVKEAKKPEFAIKAAAGGWVYVESAETEKPLGKNDEAAAEVLKGALARSEKATARVGLRITADQKKRLGEAMLEPGAMMIGGILDKLRNVETISIGLWPGENSKAELQMVFDGADSAKGFKEASDKLIVGMSQLMAMAGAAAPVDDAEKVKKEQEALRATIAPFLLQQKEGVLRTSVDMEQVKRIKALTEEAGKAGAGKEKASEGVVPAPAPQ
jgi:hypothetical protein